MNDDSVTTQQTTQERVASPPAGMGVRIGWDRRRVLLAAGVAFGAASIGLYAADGYSRAMLVLWLASVAAFLASFATTTARLPRLALLDVAIPVGLALLFVPVYLVWAFSWPVQVSSDEIVVMTIAERWGEATGIDPFGLAPDLFNVPALLFVAWGKMGGLLGGVDLHNMRLLHGASGLLAVAVSYGLFRQLLPRRWAVFAACVLGVNHSLFMLSRMAFRDNTALLVEVTALALLLHGLRREVAVSTFLGGFAAGAGFYVYYPARAVFVVWLLFLVGLAVLFRRTMPLRKLLQYGAVALAGFVLVAAPVFIAELKAPFEYQRTTSFLFPEGRDLATQWAVGNSTWDGIRQNILYGLSAFNNTIVDHSWLYPNWGHGFLDPLTGVLLWIGVAAVAWRLIRRRSDPWPLLPLIGFVTVWLTLTFLVNKAPDYTRLLIALPFVAYLATQGVRMIVGALPRVSGRSQHGHARLVIPLVAAAILAGTVAWNVAIASDYVQRGREMGDDIGSTGRYVQSRRDDPGIRFYLASSDRLPYYIWGLPWMLRDRLRPFARPGQVQPVVNATRLDHFHGREPFVLLMSRNAWSRSGRQLSGRYPAGRVRDVMPDGSRVAFEVPPAPR